MSESSRLIKPHQPPVCLAVHDICTYAKSSLSVVIPVLESMGIEVSPLPTAVLSSQIDGFDDYYHLDLKDSAKSISSCLSLENVRFDCLYSGFLSSCELAQSVNALKSLLKSQALIAVDPVLGDYGRLYSSFSDPMIDAMRPLIYEADVIKPNFTEACLLTGTEYQDLVTEKRVKEVLFKLRVLAPKADIALSGVCLAELEDMCNIACLSSDNQFWIHSHKKEPESLPGSGDFFCSVLVGQLLLGESFSSAVVTAGEQTRQCIALTRQAGFEKRHGICTALWIRNARLLQERNLR